MLNETVLCPFFVRCKNVLKIRRLITITTFPEVQRGSEMENENPTLSLLPSIKFFSDAKLKRIDIMISNKPFKTVPHPQRGTNKFIVISHQVLIIIPTKRLPEWCPLDLP